MEKFYFDETKYDTYLEQLGVEYPVINKNKWNWNFLLLIIVL
jgi:hypothetical protein